MIRKSILLALISILGSAQEKSSNFMPVFGLRLNSEEIFELSGGIGLGLGSNFEYGMLTLNAIGNHKSYGTEFQYIKYEGAFKFFVRPKIMKTYSDRNIGEIRSWTGTSTGLEAGVIADVGHMPISFYGGARKYSEIKETRYYAGIGFYF